MDEPRRGLVAFLQLRWLGRNRARGYAMMLWLASLASMYWMYIEAMGPGGSDFLAFWSAGVLTDIGKVTSVYDVQAVGQVQAALGRADVFAFVNPPPFLFVTVPLGVLGYKVAWIAWVAATYAAWFGASMRVDRRLAAPIAAFPGALLGAWHAQTGLLTGSLLAGTATLLRKRPFAAGACVGALVIKPHLAVLFPIAFIAGGQWRAFAGAAISAIGLLLLAWAVFGSATMLAYPRSWEVSRTLMDTSDRVFFLRQVTVYAALRAAGAPMIAGAVQAIVTLAVAVATWRIWSKPIAVEAQCAFLLAATPLATPYLFSYDLPFLVIPVMWMAAHAWKSGWRGWRRPLLVFFYISPLLTRALALPTGMVLTPLVQAWMVWIIWRWAHSQLRGNCAQQPGPAMPGTAQPQTSR